MKREGWTRLSAPGNKCGALWQHTSGWLVRHCGHPTANHPYYAVNPKHPGCVTVTHNGCGFGRLVVAFESIEAVLRGDARETSRRCVSGVRRVILRGQT